MKIPLATLGKFYQALILQHPRMVLMVIAAILSVSAWYAPEFRLDASSDSLILEEDEALLYYRSIRARYGSDDYLIVTFAPNNALFDPATLAQLASLRDELAALSGVSAVTSILDVPLIRSPAQSLTDLSQHTPTLQSPDTDRELAKQELLSSPLYTNLLISADGKATALRLDLHQSAQYRHLTQQRSDLRAQRLQRPLTQQEQKQLNTTLDRLETVKIAQQQQLTREVQQVRTILARYQQHAQLHLGGIPMIITDSINFIQRDLMIFGSCVVALIVIILVIAFRQLRWVLLPLLTCAASSLFMAGLLGLLDWPVTIVSGNFLPLLLIITLSLSVHLIVRYREIQTDEPNSDQYYLIKSTIESKAQPCFYTALTTIVAFASLLVSQVRPVIDFGLMMTIGVAVAFVLTFTLFPCSALLLKPAKPRPQQDWVHRLTSLTAQLIERHGNLTLVLFTLLALVSIAGATRLTVDNRFIDYFKQTTEIHRGMTFIDRNLGGTTPLDIIVDAPADFTQPQTALDRPQSEDALPGVAGRSGGITSTSYWFNSLRLQRVDKLHNAIDQHAAIGKVLSIATTMRLLRQLEDWQSQDDFFLSILYKRLPRPVHEQLIAPYLSADGSQLRFAARVFETDPSLDRDQLLNDLRQRMTEKFGLQPEQLHFTGLLVLYNNMLHSLFRSQLLTLGVVFAAVLLLFAVVFGNLRLALIALLPNLLAAGLVLGLMGMFGIPLDLMTITIAAISIGIAVDDTIHYVHRYRQEFQQDHDYQAAIKRSHTSIGRALFYTTLTITLGFSVLTLSNFVPTIYFGLFTGIAMLSALLADLTLLPLLIARFKPLG